MKPSHARAVLLAAGWLALRVTLSQAQDNWILATRPIEIAENGYVTNTVIGAARHEFCFLPPRHWTLTIATNAQRFTWTSPDQNAVLQFTLPLAPAQLTPIPRAADLRQRVLQARPNARLREQFTCYTRTHAGVAFDLEIVAPDKFTMLSRLAVIPLEGGWAELDLTTSAAQFADCQHELGLVLNSFEIAPR